MSSPTIDGGARTGKLIEIDRIASFWLLAERYFGQNFYVMSWHGPWGKPHLKACREDV